MNMCLGNMITCIMKTVFARVRHSGLVVEHLSAEPETTEVWSLVNPFFFAVNNFFAPLIELFSNYGLVLVRASVYI